MGLRQLTAHTGLRNQRGSSAGELVLALVLTGIMVAVGTPLLIASSRGAAVNGAAREVNTGLNQAKLLAVSSRQNVCVEFGSGGYRFRLGACNGAAWIGSNTNGTGLMAILDNVTVSGNSPIFTPFGNASQSGTLTVTDNKGSTLTVTVFPSGRSTIP